MNQRHGENSMGAGPLERGRRLGNYILDEEIGRGAFAQVWKAVHHERPGKVFAIKVPIDPTFRRQLCREVALPEIDHPNVVPILDSDTRFAELPYIVMPYVGGGNLTQLIAAHPNGLPEERVLSILHDVLAGLASAHCQGIVHRDIKPANILLDGNGRAQLSDFGLSFANSGFDPNRSIVQSSSLSMEGKGRLVGTPAYVAPEVIEGQPASAASDVYSIGVVLFEMLTGRRPRGIEFPEDVRACLESGFAWRSIFANLCAPTEKRPANAERALAALHRARPLCDPHERQLIQRGLEIMKSIGLEDRPSPQVNDDSAVRAFAAHMKRISAAKDDNERLDIMVAAGTVQAPRNSLERATMLSAMKKGDQEGRHLLAELVAESVSNEKRRENKIQWCVLILVWGAVLVLWLIKNL